MPPVADSALYARRRARAFEHLAPGEAMLIPAAAHASRNSDVEFPYRTRSDLLWLTGFREPGSLALLARDAEGAPSFTMFVRPRNPERETWTGRRAGIEGAQERFGADEAHPVDDLGSQLIERLERVERLYYPFLAEHPWRGDVESALRSLRAGGGRRRHATGPRTLTDSAAVLDDLRLLKTAEDLELQARAVAISAAGHNAALERARPGMFEYQIQALVEAEFLHQGADHWGYPSIVGAGENACILHYIENRDELREGDLLLIDAGAERDGFTGDITRTWPIGRAFTPAQRELYAVVLAAQEAAINRCRVGCDFDQVHQAAVQVLIDGMREVGLVSGSEDEVRESGSWKRYYMHSTSHWLGMDVHDVGGYKQAGAWRQLEPGMVLTVEPGLYIPPDDQEAPERFRGIGIRIEDDIAITDGAPRNLSAAVPKSIEELEARRRAALA